MLYSSVFFILGLQLYKVYASPTDVPRLSEVATTESTSSEGNVKGYECGNIFFRDVEIRDALATFLLRANQNYHHPQRYYGPLYSDTETIEYLMWPVIKGKQIMPTSKVVGTPFRMVFTRNGREVVDVISRTTTNEFTKCIRIDGSQTQLLASVSEGTNGYQCGLKFLGDDIIQNSLEIAQKNIGKNKIYPLPYEGELYPKETRYMIWPVLHGSKLYESGHRYTKSYFLVINSKGNLVDTVVRGFNNNYLRCSRSRQVPKAPASDPYTKLFVPAPRSGYQCGRTFFDDKILQRATNEAKSIVNYKTNLQFPYLYSGNPYNELCQLWPISSEGLLYKKGAIPPYRLVFTLDFKIKGVAFTDRVKLHTCEKKLVKGKKNHDTSNYYCAGRVFTHEILLRAAENGCEKMTTGRKNTYPASYEGLGFEIEGPYFTFPVFLDSDFKNFPGPDRVVLNPNCEVVGALTTIIQDSTKRLVKCHRKDDGPMLDDFFETQNNPIYEHPVKY